MIPQADPGAGYRARRAEIDAAVQRVLASGWYVLGAEGAAFEREFAAWLGCPHAVGCADGMQAVGCADGMQAVGCASGTDALVLALRALDIGPGCTVVTVSHTAVATVAAIELAGAAPLLLDIDVYYGLDPAELAEVLDHPPPGLPPIRAVIPVHLYGQAVDLAPILAACARHEVAVIEDCSQAHGATWQGRKLGTFGRIAAFSLYPTKNLGALGDGGILATTDPVLTGRLTALRQYGWRQRYVSDTQGMNSRLDEMQAAILRVGLAHLDAGNARRGAIAGAYDAVLRGIAPPARLGEIAPPARLGEVAPPARRPGCGHVFHQYAIQSAQRDAVQTRLRDAGIATAVHYPVPVHLQPAYAGRVALGPAGCRATAAVAGRILSLPMFPELTEAQVAAVCHALAEG